MTKNQLHNQNIYEGTRTGRKMYAMGEGGAGLKMIYGLLEILHF